MLSLQMGFVFIIANNTAVRAKHYSLISAVFLVREMMVIVKMINRRIPLILESSFFLEISPT